MPSQPNPEITQLLAQCREGDENAVNELMPILYNELRALAGRQMNAERPGNTLQATAVVNEAYMRLVGADVPYQDRTHFFAVAARTMRRVLVDHAKGKNRQKRGSGSAKVTLEEAMIVSDKNSNADLSDLDEALTRLAAQDERKAQVIELHFFGGMTYDQIAESMKISAATVHRELRMGKAWLYRELNPEA